MTIAKPPPLPPTSARKKSKDHTPKPKPEYQLTVAGENNTLENVPEINTRTRTEHIVQREAHILYTGLTPEDDVRKQFKPLLYSINKFLYVEKIRKD